MTRRLLRAGWLFRTLSSGSSVADEPYADSCLRSRWSIMGAMPIEVVAYDPRWPSRFARIRDSLREALDDVPVVSIEHVGSTSVPGLAAKPVIDVDVVIAREHLEAAIDAFVAAGYEHRGDLGIPDRYAMRAPEGVRRNVYLVVDGSLALRNHLAVRDRLRADSALARTYGALKQRLAGETDEVDDYVARKSEVLLSILAAAGFASAELDAVRTANASTAAAVPGPPVLAAFGVTGIPRPVAPHAWRAGDVLLKRAGVDLAWIEWEHRVLADVVDDRFRLQRLRAAPDGRLVVDGWLARDFLSGRHRRPDWSSVLDVADRLNDSLVRVPSALSQPLPAARTDAWAIADRMAWEEEPIPAGLGDPTVNGLVGLLGPITAESQVVHGDLTGNVLFDAELPPAVIDFSPYWRPAAYAIGVIVADAIVWEGADRGLLEGQTWRPSFGQCLIRALLFRHLSALLLPGRLPTGAAAERYAWLREAAGALA